MECPDQDNDLHEEHQAEETKTDLNTDIEVLLDLIGVHLFGIVRVRTKVIWWQHIQNVAEVKAHTGSHIKNWNYCDANSQNPH